MKRITKAWIYLILLHSVFHFIRDILQDLKVHIFFTDMFVKGAQSKAPDWYWVVFNTYLMEIAQITLALLIIKRNRFGYLGYLTIGIAASFASIWLYFWFFL